MDMDMPMPGMASPPSSPSMPAHGGASGMAAMHMTFFSGTHVQILFSGWPGDRGIGMYLLSLFFILAASALLESLSFIASRISRRPTQPLTGIMLTILHAFRMLLAYVVMLAVMSFNVGVLIAAVVGHAVGYFLCGSGVFKWSPQGDANDDCLHSAKY